MICFTYIGKWTSYEKEESTYQRTLNFVEKDHVFLGFKNTNVFTSTSKYAKKLTSRWIRTRHLWGPKCGYTHMYYTRHQRFCSALTRNGQNPEKEKTPTTELNIFLSKIFSTEIKNQNYKPRHWTTIQMFAIFQHCLEKCLG